MPTLKLNYSLASLAVKHFWLHWNIGVIITAAVIYITMIGIGKSIQNPDLIGLVIFFPFLGFGIPAALIGALRLSAMQWLFGKARHQPDEWPIGRLLRWTCLIFLGPVLPIGVCIGGWLYGLKDSDAMIIWFLLTIAISSPWLTGALIATYSIRYQIWFSDLNKTSIEFSRK